MNKNMSVSERAELNKAAGETGDTDKHLVEGARLHATSIRSKQS